MTAFSSSPVCGEATPTTSDSRTKNSTTCRQTRMKPNILRALVGLFIVLAVDACRTGRDLPGGLLAVACAVSAVLVAPEQMLLVAMSLFVALLAITSRRHTATPRTNGARA